MRRERLALIRRRLEAGMRVGRGDGAVVLGDVLMQGVVNLEFFGETCSCRVKICLFMRNV